MNAAGDLDVLVPPQVELAVAGETLVLRPLKVGQLPAFVRAIAPALQQLSAAELDWLALFGTHGEALLAAVAIAAGKPPVWVDELSADDAILLAAKVIEVNAHFFASRVAPRLDGLLAGLTLPTATPTPGSIPSNG